MSLHLVFAQPAQNRGGWLGNDDNFYAWALELYDGLKGLAVPMEVSAPRGPEKCCLPQPYAPDFPSTLLPSIKWQQLLSFPVNHPASRLP